MNFFKKIAGGLAKTRNALVGNIRAAVGAATLNEESLEALEEVLITADLGVDTSLELIDRLRSRARNQNLSGDEVLPALREELTAMIAEGSARRQQAAPDKVTDEGEPRVIFVVGVNGAGKTTTMGKLAARYREHGQRVLLVAADTFRSAAVEQAQIWAERAGVEIVKGATGADPGAVLYDGLGAARARGVDLVLVDTAGRLHTKVNLMAELGKLDRVAKKQIPNAPHEVLLVVDGTTGQNGLAQARAFAETLPVSGVIVTKLDGTAKGGVLVPIGRELGLPVEWIGVGEGMDDLLPFEPELIVQAVFGDEASLARAQELLASSEEEAGEDGEPGHEAAGESEEERNDASAPFSAED